MLSIILMIITVLSAILALIQKDLLKAAILTGFSGGALAVLFQLLLAPDVALTQAIVGVAIVPGYKPGGVVPILMPGMSPSWFAVNSAYPLPFGLVLTSIVIGASTLAVMLAIVMVIYKKYGTLSTKVLLADTSKQEEYDE